MATPLTPKMLRSIMPLIPGRDEYKEFDACCATMRRFGINTKKRAAAWLGNVAKESGELRYTEELASGAAYEGRADLGNVRPGDGVRFKGRGYIQITGRANYTRISEDLKIPCVAEPEILERMPHRWTTAGYYWRRMSSLGNLNLIADAGNFERTVLGVRGGPDPSSRVYYDRAMRVLPNDLTIPDGEEPSVPDLPGWKKGSLIPPNFEPLKPRPGNYQQRHPSRYEWRSDVADLIRRLYREFPNVHVNTYVEHPEGWGWDTVSFDVWGERGRNDPIGLDRGDKVFRFLFNDPNPPDIEWCIWRRKIYARANNYRPEPFGTETFSWHEDHPHFTYRPPYKRLY